MSSQYNYVFLKDSESTPSFQKLKNIVKVFIQFLLLPYLFYLFLSVLSIFFQNSVNFHIARYILLILLPFVILKFFWKNLFKCLYTIYQDIKHPIRNLHPFIINKNGIHKNYLPVPKLSNHIFWIKKHMDTNPAHSHYNAIIIFSTSVDIDSSIKSSLYKLYSFYYIFSNSINIMLFFILSFFTITAIYSMGIFVLFDFLTYLLKEGIFLKKSIIYIFVPTLILLFGFTIFLYVNEFQFKFLKNEIQEIDENKENLPIQYSIYYYQNPIVKPAISPNIIVKEVGIIQEKLSSSINSILQISIPIFFFTYITIFISILSQLSQLSQGCNP